LLAPAGTPRPVIERLHAAVIEVMALPETRERMAASCLIARLQGNLFQEA